MKSLRLAAGAFVCALMVGALGAARPALAVTLANCTGTQLVPALGDATVNQGVGNYQYLIRGKETLVKFFLTTPTGCTLTNSQSITIQRATLSVDNGSGQFGPISAFQSFATNPAVSTTLSANSPADPIFVVPSTALTPGLGGATFTPTFTATITYSMINGKTVTANQTATFTKTGVTFDKKTNALRVLVVPMGDATAGVLASTQYTPTDQTSTQNGFSALSRIFPVPSGISDLSGTLTGIRYVIDLAALVNLKAVTGAYDSNLKFCGQKGNFDAIKAQLAQFMQSWNSVSTNPPVDRVLGVVGEGISDGASVGCAEGMASVVSPEAWVRANADKPASGKTPAQPSRTGSLMAMELAHTWGSEPDTSFHSPNVTADTSPGAANRVYNVTTRSLLATNRSVMNFSFPLNPPWDDTLTALEPDDYSFDRCALGGTTAGVADCSAVSTAAGTNFGVASQGPFIVSGTIDTSSAPETADVVQSGFLPSQTIGAQADSAYRYVRRNANTSAPELNLGFHVSFVDSIHSNANGGNDDPPTGQGLFSFALPDNPSLDYTNDPAEVQIWKVTNTSSSYNPSTVAGDTLLYDKSQQAQPPTVTSIVIGAAPQPSNYTNTPLIDEHAPALTDNGRWVAWNQFNSDPAVDALGIQIGPSNDHSQAVFVPTPAGGDAANPAWNPAGTALAYDVGGDIYTQTVNVSGATPTFGAPVKVYNQFVGEFNFPARNPSWSGDGNSLAIEINTGGGPDIYTIPSTGVSDIDSATEITDLGDASEPSWSHTPGDNRIAFEAPCIEVCTSIEVVDPATKDPVAVTSGELPSYGTNGRIAFVSGNNIWTINPDNTETLTPITAGARDSAPAMVGNTFAFLRLFPSAGICEVRVCSQIDIMLTTAGGPQHAISFTGVSTAPLKGELDYVCNGLTYPVQVGLTPSQISGTAQTFLAQFDGSDACGGGTLVARVTDGVQYSSGTPAPDVSGTLTVDRKPPTAAIYAPLDSFYGAGPSFATFPLNGTGYDAEGRTLPDASLHWTLTKPDGTVQDLGNFGSKDLGAPAGGWPQGTYTFTLVATDGDNVQSAPVTRQVHIGYIFSGGVFRPPLANPPDVNTGKPGAQFPLKWQLLDATGQAITDLKAVRSLQYETAGGTPGHCDFSTTHNPVNLMPTGSTLLRADGSQYIFNWTTPSSAGCYVLELTLGDGSEHDAWFALS